MNKDFIIEDKNNNLQKKASGIVKFNYENKDYIVYCVDENNDNKQIFVSRLILNSEGKYFIENILPEEKSKLNNIVYNIVILAPSNAKKGMNGKELINDLTEKNMLKLSCDIPELNNQEYFSNCSMAITNKEFVEEASKFYETNLNEVKEEVNVQTPSWTLPINEEVKIEPVAVEENTSTQVAEPMEMPVSEINTNNETITPSLPVQPAVMPEPIPVTPVVESVQVPIEETKPEVIAPIVPETNNIVSEPITMPKAETVINPVATEPVVQTIPAAVSSEQTAAAPIESNPQIEKLENVAIVSDPSLSAAGVNVQQNAGQQNIGQQKVKTLKKAGFAINKYIVIGTLCILLSIAVVIVAYILIKKKTTGV